MPELSRFLGIVIKMFYNDHNPPHFHAVYENSEGVFTINSLEMIQGDLPPRIQGIIIEWASIHKRELLENWKLVTKKDHQTFKKIKPLV